MKTVSKFSYISRRREHATDNRQKINRQINMPGKVYYREVFRARCVKEKKACYDDRRSDNVKIQQSSKSVTDHSRKQFGSFGLALQLLHIAIATSLSLLYLIYLSLVCYGFCFRMRVGSIHRKKRISIRKLSIESSLNLVP